MNLSCPRGIEEQHHRLLHATFSWAWDITHRRGRSLTNPGLWMKDSAGSVNMQDFTRTNTYPKFSNNASLKADKKRWKIMHWSSQALGEIPAWGEGRLWESVGEIWPCFSSNQGQPGRLLQLHGLCSHPTAPWRLGGALMPAMPFL